MTNASKYADALKLAGSPAMMAASVTTSWCEAPGKAGGGKDGGARGEGGGAGGCGDGGGSGGGGKGGCGGDGGAGGGDGSGTRVAQISKPFFLMVLGQIVFTNQLNVSPLAMYTC